MHRSITLSILALALTCVAQPAGAQDAASCVDEVQRLSEGLPLVNAGDREAAAAAIAQQPGTRRGASLGEEQRQRIADLIEQARTAGEQGDGGRCVQGLAEARALLREAGFGSGQPGSATTGVRLGTGPAGAGTTSSGVAGGASSPATSPGAGAAATTGAGAATTGVGGAATDVGPGTAGVGAGTTGVGAATTGVGPATTGVGAATTGAGAATTGAGAAGGTGTAGGGALGGGGGAAGGAGGTGG